MFDEQISRLQTSCYKWDMQKKICGREGLIPFWVADMDFKSPPAVLEALQHRLDHGIFGYTYTSADVSKALILWFKRRHNWEIKPESLVEIPSVVTFIYIYTEFFTSDNEAVVIQEPVYYPLRSALIDTGRKVADNPLIQNSDNCWQIDFNGLALSLEQTEARNLFFCNPHNPVGRVWTKEELQTLATLCRKRGVRIISDEIHADFAMPGYNYTPFLTLGSDTLPQSIALISPNKTFNLQGLNTAWAVIPDQGFREKVQKMLKHLHLESGSGNSFSYIATKAAWLESDKWVDQLITYISENYQFLSSFIHEKIPHARLTEMEGTFLAWIDFSELGLSDDEIWKRFLDHGIWLSRGSIFGKGGKGFWRMNIACPRERLADGLEKMGKALQ